MRLAQYYPDTCAETNLALEASLLSTFNVELTLVMYLLNNNPQYFVDSIYSVTDMPLSPPSLAAGDCRRMCFLPSDSYTHHNQIISAYL